MNIMNELYGNMHGNPVRGLLHITIVIRFYPPTLYLIRIYYIIA